MTKSPSMPICRNVGRCVCQPGGNRFCLKKWTIRAICTDGPFRMEMSSEAPRNTGGSTEMTGFTARPRHAMLMALRWTDCMH